MTLKPDIFNLPVTALAGVGSKIAEQLDQLGIERVFDLLLHLPRDYEDRSRLVNMCDVVDGQSALLQGTVVRVDNKKMGLSVTLQDRTAQTTLRFFKVYRGLTETMAVGNTLRVFGEISISKYGTQISHPEYEIITGHQPLTNTGLIPVYPTVKTYIKINCVA